MAQIDDESYLDSLLEEIGDVDDIVATEEIGVEKLVEELEEASSLIDLDALLRSQEAEETAKLNEEEEATPVQEAASNDAESIADTTEDIAEALSDDEIKALLGDNIDLAELLNGDSELEVDSVETSEEELKRLESMGLDSILDEVNNSIEGNNTIDYDFGDDEDSLDSDAKEDDSDVDRDSRFLASLLESANPARSTYDENSYMDSILNEEAGSSSKKSKKKKADKKKSGKPGLLSVLKKVFFENPDEDMQIEDVKKAKKAGKKDKKAAASNQVSDAKLSGKDENEQLIAEVFGDKDTLDNSVAPKMGFVAKIKYRFEQFRLKNEEEERLEDEAEALEAEARKQKKEEDKVLKAAKKEEAKKAKEAKAKEKQEKAKEKANAKPKKEKPKKEKKPKPEPKPEDILKIKPKSLILFLLLIISLCALVFIGNSAITYTSNASRARAYFEDGEYGRAYDELSGLKLSKGDQSLYEQASLVMFVRRQYDSYLNFKTLSMHTEAMNALFKGLDRYDSFYREATALGIDNIYDELRDTILEALSTDYGIDEDEANSLLDMSRDDFKEFYLLINNKGKAMK